MHRKFYKGSLLQLFGGALLLICIGGFSGGSLDLQEYIVYVGAYTSNAAKGIYAFRFQPSSGKTTAIELAAETANPSFLAIHPTKRLLYAANEVSNYEGRNGFLSAFAIDGKTGRLSFLNKVPSGGSDPCHVAVDKSGKWLLAANYSSGSVAVLPIGQDGTLGKISALIQHSGSGKDPRRQEGPHAHSVNLSPDNRFLLVSDLGLDKIMIYRFDAAKGSVKANDPAFVGVSPGSGPRHLAFHPQGRFVYQINELNSTLTSFAYDPVRGSLRDIGTISTLSAGFSGRSSTAEVEAHPNGKFVYGSNRGHDSIAVFAVKESEGVPVLIGHVPTQGKNPRHFAVDPTGNFLFAANQNSDQVVLFRIDRETGMLTPTGDVLSIPTPACVIFMPAP
jgi:6-phosphogluconolactonase